MVIESDCGYRAKRAWPHATAAALVCALPAAAQAGGDWFGSLAATSDYVFRGLSQNMGDPALQGEIGWRHDAGWQVGTWGSQVDLNPGDGANFEVDAYVSLSRPFAGDWRYRLALVRYIYPEDPPELDYDYTEASVALSFRDVVTASVSWSPDTSRYGHGYVAEDETAIAYELSTEWPVTDHLVWSLGAGLYDLDALFGESYRYWSTGLAYVRGGWSVDVSAIDTSSEAEELFGDENTGSRVAFTLTRQFR